MAWDGEEIQRVCELALKMKDRPYQFGAKWPLTDTNPQAPVDCSGFSRWIIGQGRDAHGRQIVLPHSCINQIKVCKPLALERPLVLDLGFADLIGQDGAPDHVVVRISESLVIEARGCKTHLGHKPELCPYKKVVLRPAAVWDAQKGFMGWWRVPGLRDG